MNDRTTKDCIDRKVYYTEQLSKRIYTRETNMKRVTNIT